MPVQKPRLTASSRYVRRHAQGDTGSGVSFRAMMYVPSSVPDDFWQKITAGVRNIRLMVKVSVARDDDPRRG